VRAVIRIGDKTDHGGEVLEGFEHFDVEDRMAAGVGLRVSCPKCGENVIAQAGTWPDLQWNRN